MTWLVGRGFTQDEQLHPDMKAIERPESWGSFAWNREKFDLSAGEIVVHLADELEPFPDFLKAYRIPLVSEKVRYLVETLEPGTHQFLPSSVLNPSGKPVPKKFWGLNVVQSAEAVIAERSNVDVVEVPASLQKERGASRFLRLKGSPQLAVDAAMIEGHHLWVSREFPAHYFISDTLMSSFEAAGVWKLDAVRVLDI